MSEGDAEVIVIGAGIAGLMAANFLQKQGKRVLVLELEASVGGRMATRQVGPGRADYGAQFFTARSQEFRNWISQWLYEKVIYLWSMGWSTGSLGPLVNDGHPRYVAHNGMQALAQHLAQDLDDLRCNVQIAMATAAGEEWILYDASGQDYGCRALIMTPPVPQSLEILRAGATVLVESDRAALERIQYAPCLAGLFWVDGRVILPEPGAIQRPDDPISWIADNQRKGISREAPIMTIHASPQYSQQMWAVPEAEVTAALRASLKPYLDEQAVIREGQLKRWRYSLPVVLHEASCLMAEGLPPLIFAGDAFHQPRVEGAALSGIAAGRAMLERLATS